MNLKSIVNKRIQETVPKKYYSLQPILLSVNTDVSSTKMCVDTSIFGKGNMGQRE
jgi:hypothetical protein